MHYLNSVNIAGYLTRDPTGNSTNKGIPRVKFSVTLNHPVKKIPYHMKCVAWGERAAQILRYAARGQEIIVSGEFENSTWKDKHGTSHTTTEIVVDTFNLGTKSKREEGVGDANLRRPSPIVIPE